MKTFSLPSIFLLCTISILIVFGCKPKIEKTKNNNVISSDIDLFWEAFDAITKIKDSTEQVLVFDSLYTKKGTEGLGTLMQVRNYSSAEYVQLINTYPKFWASIRANTLKAHTIKEDLNTGITMLEDLYSPLKPAKIYIAMGCMRTNGTTLGDKVMIGAELALLDESADVSEFDDATREWLEGLIEEKPQANLVFLNVHEYVHTQQQPISDQLLYISLYEGVAEYVTTLAMDMPSSTPAIKYGKGNPKVKEAFEKEMFYNYTFNWLWSNYPNQFGTRDLGYHIGYEMAETYVNSQADKEEAVKTLIELDYTDTDTIDKFIDDLNFFSKSIAELKEEDRGSRPKVATVKQFENGSQDVNPNIKQITFEFSEALNGMNSGLDLGPLGREAFPKVNDRKWAETFKSWSLDVELEPNKIYQILLSNNFRNKENEALVPYLLEFKTGG